MAECYYYLPNLSSLSSADDDGDVLAEVMIPAMTLQGNTETRGGELSTYGAQVNVF